MENLINSFLDYLKLERACSPGTVLKYGAHLLDFERYLKDVDEELTLETATGDLVRDWMMQLRERGDKASTINARLSSLRTFYKYLLRKGIVTVDPMLKVHGMKKSKPLPSFVREEDMDAILDESRFAETWEGKRDRLILQMFYETGMRRAELCGLNESDVDYYRSVIKVTGKRNKQRLIPFGDELCESMQAYQAAMHAEVEATDGAFFVRKDGTRYSYASLYQLVHRHLSQTSLEKRSPHVLRHTFATAMLNNGAELQSVKELLGHESVSTTEIYTHTTFEELKAVYEQAFPRERERKHSSAQ